MSLGTETWVGASATSTSSPSIALNNMGANRIVVLAIHTVNNDSAAAASVSSVTSPGLTWAKYTSYAFASSDATVFQRIEIWWAYAAVQQSSQTISVTLSRAAWGVNLGVGNISGVSSGRYSNPWDADPSLPAVNSNPSATGSVGQYNFSTHDSQDVGYVAWGSAISGDSPAAPAGWTKAIDITISNGGIAFMELQVYFQIFSAQQVNTNVNFGSQRNFGFIGAAVGGNQIFPYQQAICVGF